MPAVGLPQPRNPCWSLLGGWRSGEEGAPAGGHVPIGCPSKGGPSGWRSQRHPSPTHAWPWAAGCGSSLRAGCPAAHDCSGMSHSALVPPEPIPQIPLNIDIRQAADVGAPIVAAQPDSAAAQVSYGTRRVLLPTHSCCRWGVA